MKKIIFTVLAAVSFGATFAQSAETIKETTVIYKSESQAFDTTSLFAVNVW